MIMIEKIGNFMVGEVGCTDFSGYIASLPAIDFIYSAPPNSYMLSWWYRNELQSKPEIKYSNLLTGLQAVIQQCSPAEFHIEYDCPALEKLLLQLASGYSNMQARQLVYAAPSRGKHLSRRKKKTFLLSASNTRILDFEFDSSDTFLDGILRSRPPMACYDPFMGKGLLACIAARYGHTAYGSDISRERLLFAKNNMHAWKENGQD